MKNKSALSIILTLIMIVTLIPVASYGQSNDFYVKVGLAYGTTASNTVTISADSSLMLCETDRVNAPTDSNSEAALALEEAGVSSVILVNNATGIKVYDTTLYSSTNNSGYPEGTGETDLGLITTLSGDGSEFICSSAYFSNNEPIKYSGVGYRGGIIPYRNSNINLNIINYLRSDDYVRGVLHAEIGQSSALETIKAQAVSVRSYVYTNNNKHSSQGFGVCSTTHCQVYKGISAEYPSTNKAADETSGEMMYYNGSPVAGFYSANSGGHTQNSEDVWSSKVGYLRGKVDEFSPEYKWEVKITKAQLDAALASRGIGKVNCVSINSYNSAGAAASVTVYGTNGSFTINKDSIRSMFGSKYSLKSTMFTFSTEGGSTEPSATGNITQTPSEPVYALDSSGNKIKLSSSLYSISSTGVSKINLKGLNILDGKGSKRVVIAADSENEISAVAGDAIYLNDDSDVLIISGKGYGHGVGMSQQGAQAMGKLGYTYKEILQYYYTDIEIK